MKSVVCVLCALYVAILMTASRSAARKSTLLNATPECNQENYERVELEVARLTFFGPDGRPPPESFGRLKAYCKSIDAVESYVNRCFRLQSRNTINVLFYSTKNTYKQFCLKSKKNKKLKALMPVIPCFNREIRADDGCIRAFINESKQLVPLDDHKIKLPHICCNYLQFLQCVGDRIDRVDCIRTQKETIMDFIQGLFQNLIHVICGEYNESTDRCVTLAHAPKPSKPNTKYYRSFLFVIMDILNSLP